MAEDVASREIGAEALPPEARERVERAAARFDSIHARWSLPGSSVELGTDGLSSAARDGAAAARSMPPEPALLDRDAVSVTPILGIETDESELEGRPRFKTLMGVPRSSPELDELAGLDIDSGRHDTVRLERSALVSLERSALMSLERSALRPS